MGILFFYYFELFYKQRQIYRVKSSKSCDMWIEKINAAIIYNKYWLLMCQKNPQASEYLLFNQGEESTSIPFSDKEKIENIIEKEAENKQNEEKVGENKNEANVNKSSEISNTSQEGKKKVKKKKERRLNPYTKEATDDIQLAEDATLAKGITFSSFEILDTLGSGTFGKVFKVKLKGTEEIFAMKIINKKYLIKNQQLRYAVTECNVLKSATNPFIITLHYAFQTPEHLYMILDYCPGGDLSYHIVKNLFEEEEARFFIAELILAI